MCISKTHCDECVVRGTMPDIVDYEQLRRHEHEPISDVNLAVATQFRRHLNIQAAIARGDLVVLEAPELSSQVREYYFQVRNNRFNLPVGKNAYAEFISYTARFGIALEPVTCRDDQSRMKRIHWAHDTHAAKIEILLFSLRYGFDPIAVSAAINRQVSTSPILQEVVNDNGLPFAIAA